MPTSPVCPYRLRRPLGLLALPLLLLAFALAGCDSAAGDEPGAFRVLLTDAPGDFVRAVVTVEEVYLQGGDEDDSGRVLLRSEPVTVNLLDLQNEVLTLVEEQAVPAGTYAQLRLRISGGFIEVEAEGGGTLVYASSDAYAEALGVQAEGRLQMPSYDASGLKVDLPGGGVAVGGEQRVVLLDFDVAESFGRRAGQSGLWVMNPVVRASDFALTGTAEVAVALAEGVALPAGVTLDDFTVALDKGGDVLEVPVAEGDGGAFTATFRYLAPGTYPITLLGPDGLTFEAEPALPLTLTVESGGAAQEVITLTVVAR